VTSRLLVWAIRRYAKRPGQAWVLTTVALIGMRAARSILGRRELIDVGRIKPGETVLIQNLEISHRQQMKTFKAEEKEAKRARKAAKRDESAQKRSARKQRRSDRLAGMLEE